jgi:regulation of enolase protein 1 (concanavalin A-like superfamily)
VFLVAVLFLTCRAGAAEPVVPAPKESGPTESQQHDVQGQKPPERQAPATQGPVVLAHDAFDGKLGLAWDIVNPLASYWSLSKNPGTLTITTRAGTFTRQRTDYKNLFLIDCPGARGQDFQITTCLVSFQPKDLWHQAGLVLWNDEDNFLSLVYEWGEGPPELEQKNQRLFSACVEREGQPVFAWYYADQDQDKVWLRVTKRRNRFELSASGDGVTFTPLDPMRTRGVADSLATWGKGVVRRVGLFAGNGSARDAEPVDASFDFFEVKTLDTSGESGGNPDTQIGACVNLGPNVNTGCHEGAPDISADGMTLYFEALGRPGGLGGCDIWMSRAKTPHQDFSLAVPLPAPVNSPSDESGPCLSDDGLTLYFASNRPGGSGDFDLWVATRETTEGSWSEPVNLGPTVNSRYDDNHPSISADGLTLYFDSRRPGIPGQSGCNDIYMTKRATVNDPWGEPEPLAVNTEEDEYSPEIARDGLTLYYDSHLAGRDIWVTKRAAPDEAWEKGVPLGPPFNTPGIDTDPSLSDNTTLLYFASDRPGGYGEFDIWVMDTQQKRDSEPSHRQPPLLPDSSPPRRRRISDAIEVLPGHVETQGRRVQNGPVSLFSLRLGVSSRVDFGCGRRPRCGEPEFYSN